MAAATVTSTTYGYRVTGGTDETTVSNNMLRVKGFIYVPDDANDKVTLKDKNGNAICIYDGVTADRPEEHDMWGSPVEGLKVTLDDADSILLIIIA